MTRSDGVDPDDAFGLWYRVRMGVLIALLQVAGPPQLQAHNDPRVLVEQDYKRRRDLHRKRLGKPPIVDKPPRVDDGTLIVVLCVAGAVLAVGVLVAWAVVSAR